MNKEVYLKIMILIKLKEVLLIGLARNPGEGLELISPYVPSADLFKAEKNKHAAKLSEISKMPKADKLLMNIEKAEEEVATPEAITD